MTDLLLPEPSIPAGDTGSTGARPGPRWSQEHIPWHRFRRDLVDNETLHLVKAASLVEHNAASYGRYLHGVFHDDPAIRSAIDRWVVEEEQHGAVLRRWARLADPGFDGDAALAHFSEAIRLPEGSPVSVRGSRLGELVARCTVEVGTLTFYTALRASVAEPALRTICQLIASDEARHYRLFLDHARRYRGTRSRLRMLGVALGRIADTGDDELARAWHSCTADGRCYRRRRASAAFHFASLRRYRPPHLARAARLVVQAVGYDTDEWLVGLGANLGWRLLRRQLRWAGATR